MVHLWRTTLEVLDSDGIPVQQRAFLSLAKLVGLIDDTVLIAVPNDFTKEIIETRLRDRVAATLGQQLGRDVRLAVTVDPSLADAPPTTDGHDTSSTAAAPEGVDDGHDRRAAGRRQQIVDLDIGEDEVDAGDGHGHLGDHGAADAAPGPNAIGIPDLVEVPGARRPRPHTQVPELVELTRLNPKYTFDTFVIGSSNRFAHAAAVAVAEAPAKATTRCSSTATPGWARPTCCTRSATTPQIFPHVKVRYVNSEEFTNDFINSIRDDKAANFQRRYRDVDVLLIDDIQFLQGKVQTQEEFFHTFNTLHNANKQVVITSDVPPKLLSRLRGADAQPVRVGLHHRRPAARPRDPDRDPAQEDHPGAAEVPDEVLEFIASRSPNIRELEGALIRVTAFASLNRQPVDSSLAEIVLKDLMPDDARARSPRRRSWRRRRPTSGSRGRPAGPVPLRGCWSPPARSPCTCAASSPTVAAEDRAAVRRPRPHHRDARRPQDPPADGRARAIYNQVTELTNRIKQQSDRRCPQAVHTARGGPHRGERARHGSISSTAVLKPVENPFSCTPLPPQFMLSHAGLSTTPVENLGCRWTSHPLDVDDARRRRGRPVNEPWVSTGPPTVVHSSSTTGPHPGSPR
jgi:chromosomal replication initiator protein